MIKDKIEVPCPIQRFIDLRGHSSLPFFDFMRSGTPPADQNVFRTFPGKVCTLLEDNDLLARPLLQGEVTCFGCYNVFS